MAITHEERMKLPDNLKFKETLVDRQRNINRKKNKLARKTRRCTN